MKLKRISRMKQGKVNKTNNQLLLEKRASLIREVNEINEKIKHGRKLTLHQALNKEYMVYATKKGIETIGGRISVPLCLVGKIVKFKLVKER